MIGKVEIIPVQPNLVPWWWTFAEPFVTAAMAHNFGEATPDDIRAACQDRNMQLWVISRKKLTIGAATTMLVNYDRKRVVRVVTLGGKDFDQWVQQGIEYLKVWGIEAGCTDIEICVRRGFERKLTEFGFETGHIVMIASLGAKNERRV